MNRKSMGILGLLCLLCGLMTVMTSDPWYDIFHGTFLQPNNIENLLRRTSMYGLLGIGVAFVIITSGIDLSIGSVVCLSGCCLALLLHVDYRSANQLEVLQVIPAESSLYVESMGKNTVKLQAGDKIRLSGARRAKNAILTLKSVEEIGLEKDGRVKAATLLTVDGELSRDDDSGQIASVYPVVRFRPMTADQSPELVVGGDANRLGLGPRDRVMLVHPLQGQKQIEITGVRETGEGLALTLLRDLGADFSTEWLAIPQQRHQRMSIPMALLAVLGIAGTLGLIHGLLITRVHLQPFVVTLCGLLFYRGLSRKLVNDQPVGFGNEFSNTLSPLGSGKLLITESFGIPYPVFIMIGVAVAAAIFLNLTIWGRYLLALGRNEEAAKYSGINTERTTIIAYVICSMAAAVGGMLFALDSNSVSPSSFGNFFELYAIAAAVLGGCSLRGGEGTIAGVMIGTAVMQVLNNVIVLMRISDELEPVIIGAVILLGVMGDEIIRRLSAARRARTPAT